LARIFQIDVVIRVEDKKHKLVYDDVLAFVEMLYREKNILSYGVESRLANLKKGGKK